MSFPRLPRSAIDEVFQLVSALQLDRDALWAGIEAPAVHGSLPLKATAQTADNYSAQLLLDLDDLNSTGRLPNGPDPLERWLNNAVLLTRPRPEADRLEHYRSILAPATLHATTFTDRPAKHLRILYLHSSPRRVGTTWIGSRSAVAELRGRGHEIKLAWHIGERPNPDDLGISDSIATPAEVVRFNPQALICENGLFHGTMRIASQVFD